MDGIFNQPSRKGGYESSWLDSVYSFQHSFNAKINKNMGDTGPELAAAALPFCDCKACLFIYKLLGTVTMEKITFYLFKEISEQPVADFSLGFLESQEQHRSVLISVCNRHSKVYMDECIHYLENAYV